ncbi:tumor necrosis factor ligand superfamily member 15-like [Anguilla anguilla]|uniref:tumor necrosis factor ligand superfamily member 15-like n=1 Tax=Anguilla anguilla TaxID=7936 RepID=UPI0015AFF582|nr:tumor necrosis factor ligand superfamily member 15-like [Anguilla anguilla]
MVRVCSESNGIQCEEGEINGLQSGDNVAVLILLDHCRAARRQECLSRLAMAFLLISSLAVFFFFRMTPQHVDSTREYGFSQFRQQRDNPHAHLTILDPAALCPTTKTNTLAWEPKDGLAHTDSFHYDNKKQALVIQSTGFYVVYLQITFRKPEEPVCDPKRGPILLAAEVYAGIPSYTESTLMTLYESMPCIGLYRKSVFTSGIYLLESNTELSVNVSRIDLVDRYSETKTYFGAFFFDVEKQ